MSNCPVLSHKKCPGAKVCETCGGGGFHFDYVPLPSRVKRKQVKCTTCHGTGQTCESAGKACRWMDAEVEALTPAPKSCDTCGRGKHDPMCIMDCFKLSHWQHPAYTSDDAKRSVLTGLLERCEELGYMFNLRVDTPTRAIVDRVYVALMERKEEVDNG